MDVRAVSWPLRTTRHGRTDPRGSPPRNEIRLEGPRAGLAFNYIYEAHLSHCCWVLLTADQGDKRQNPHLLCLAAYVRQRELQEASVDQAMREEEEADDF